MSELSGFDLLCLWGIFMNKTSLMIMGGALLFAFIVALVVGAKLSPKPQKEVVKIGSEVLAAVKDLPAGEVLKPEDVQWISYPDTMVFQGVIKKADQPNLDKLDVYGKALKRDVHIGEPITTQALADSQGGNYLAAALKPGMRAVGIPVRLETMAGGLVSPGDYVDVILDFQVNLHGDAQNYSADTVQRFASETILSNVHVLAVDQDAKDDAHEASKLARTVTLEVNKKGAEVLSMASSMGQLTLALRRLGEKDPETTDENDDFITDVNTSKVIQQVYKNQAAGGSKTTDFNVRLYSGGNVTNVPVRPDPQPAVGQ
jgi:pilus assembly protein CpaB